MKRELPLKAVVAVEAAPPQLAKRHAFSATLATPLSDDSGPTGLFPFAKYCTRLQPEPLPVCAGGDSSVSLEEFAEKRDILITDGLTDLLHGAIVALQQALGGGDS